MPRRRTRFSADEYILSNHVRSVLCLPLIRQTALVGVLYLENNLAPRVFTSAKLAVLKLLGLPGGDFAGERATL